MNSLGLGPVYTDKSLQPGGWSYLLDCHFFLQTKFLTLSLSHVAVKFADYVFEDYIDVDSKFPPTLWAQPPNVSGAIPHTNNGAELIIVIWILCERSQHAVYMFVDVLKKVQQTAYVAMNSVSQPACIAKHEWEKRQFAVAAFYDYCTHGLTRQQYLRRKVCHHYGPRPVKVWYSFAIVFSRGFVCLLFLNRCAFLDFSHAFFYTFSMRFCILFFMRFHNISKCVFMVI